MLRNVFTKTEGGADSPLSVPVDAAVPRARARESLSPALHSPFHETRFGWLVLAVVWVASAIYLWVNLRQGWISFDVGMLAEQALRTLHGQVPQRDFWGLYTGGLSYLNALAFRLFGVNLFSLRIPLFLFFLGWVPSVYFASRRFTPPLPAGALTLLAVAWSVPNYPEAMPSWYNLFFATWGVLALLRYSETEKRRWLWIAGACGGLSFLAKITGLYFVAAALVFFIFREQSLSRRAKGSGRRNVSYQLFVTGGLSLFLVVLVHLVSERPTASELLQFALPSACLVTFLLWRNWRWGHGSETAGFPRFFGETLPFLGGALAPVSFFLAWYASQGALVAWFDGVFIRPMIRTHWSAFNPIPPLVLLGLLPAMAIAAAAVNRSGFTRRLVRWAAPVALLALLLAAWVSAAIYLFIGSSPPLLVPLLAVATPIFLLRSSNLLEINRQQVFLLVSAAVFCALIQFPFSVPVYFDYVAPLVILAAAGLLAPRGKTDRVALGSLVAFYLLFAVWLHTPGYFVDYNRVPPRHEVPLQTIGLARAGDIRAQAPLAAEIRTLITVVRTHTKGPYIYATPDIPFVYFLSGFQNPTPTISDLFDPDFFNPVGRDQRILTTLEDHAVNLVVLGPGDRTLSGKVQPGLRALLDARYPESATVGQFQVRWRS